MPLFLADIGRRALSIAARWRETEIETGAQYGLNTSSSDQLAALAWRFEQLACCLLGLWPRCLATCLLQPPLHSPRRRLLPLHPKMPPSHRVGWLGCGTDTRDGSVWPGVFELIPGQLCDILLPKWEHEDDDWLKWTPDVLFTYILRTFETGVVSQASAEGSLRILSAAVLMVTFLCKCSTSYTNRLLIFDVLVSTHARRSQTLNTAK
jgi:hypothetical protein